MPRVLPLAALLTLAAAAPAGKFNKTLSVGDKAPAWSDLDGTDGKKHSLADLKDTPVVVLVFTCNSCPVAVGYEDRIIAFAQKHAGRVAVVAVNVNTIPEDRLPKMTERAEKKKFPFPYLYDPTQQIAKKYGAVYTPEFFVLGPDRTVVYMGAMDDKSPPADATVSFLEKDVESAVAGRKPEVGETLGRGCKIRFERKRTDDGE